MALEIDIMMDQIRPIELLRMARIGSRTLKRQKSMTVPLDQWMRAARRFKAFAKQSVAMAAELADIFKLGSLDTYGKVGLETMAHANDADSETSTTSILVADVTVLI